jgi:hypothetical protein
MLPASLEPQRKWDRWVEEQKKAYNQAQATRPDSVIKKGEKESDTYLAAKSVTYLPSHGSNHLAAEKERLTYLPSHVPNPYLPVPEFHHSLCFRQTEVARFLKETAEERRASAKTEPAAPGFHGREVRSKQLGCVKCGDTADHGTDACPKIATMSPGDWKRLAGDLCLRCGLHEYRLGVKCTYVCGKCGENHMTGRHGFWAKKRKDPSGPKGGPGPKKARRGPPPSAYAAQQQRPPYQDTSYPPPQVPQYGPPPPSYHYAPSRELQHPPPPPPQAGPPPPRTEQEVFDAGRQAEKAAQKKRQAKKARKGGQGPKIKEEKREKGQ